MGDEIIIIESLKKLKLEIPPIPIPIENILCDDVLKLTNEYLTVSESCNLRQTNRYFSKFPIHFRETFVEFNQNYSGVYPLLIKDLREVIMHLDSELTAPCTNCNRVKTLSTMGILFLEETVDSEFHEKFKRLKLKNIISTNIQLCKFENIKELTMENTYAESYFHFPVNLESLILKDCHFTNIQLPQFLKKLTIQDSEIQHMEVNEHLKELYVEDSEIIMEGDPILDKLYIINCQFIGQEIRESTINEIVLINVENLFTEGIIAKEAFIFNSETEQNIQYVYKIDVDDPRISKIFERIVI